MEDNKPLMEPFSDSESEEMWDNIIARIRLQEEKKRKRNFSRFLSLSVAATLVLLGTIMTYRYLYLPDVYQASQNLLTVILKDGSKVTLSKGAKLTVKNSFPAETRDVYLEGDAIFQVRKSEEHPFIVHGNSYQTKVLGTVFKVIQKGKSFTVDLYEGKVEVTRTEKPKEIFVLQPKQTFSNMGSFKIATVLPTSKEDSKTVIANSNLIFKEIPLSEAMEVLEKTYGVRIHYPTNQAPTKISINTRNVHIDNILHSIAIYLNLKSVKLNAETFELEE